MPRALILSSTALRMLAVTALSLSMLSACGQAEEAANEAATEAAIESLAEGEVDVDVSDGGQTVSGVDEQGRAFTVTQGEAATLPDGFPDDLLLPEGLTLETSMVVGGNMVVGGQLSGRLADVAETLDAQMKAAGWTSVMAMIEPSSSTQLWQKGERGVSYVLEARGEDGMELVLSYAATADEASATAAPAP